MYKESTRIRFQDNIINIYFKYKEYFYYFYQ